MKFRSVVFSVVILLLASFAVFAAGGVDDRGNPNDPATNERANACFEGGSMDGKCTTTDIDENGSVEEWEIDWHFECGWYLIRYEYNMISENALPEGCLYVPGEPAMSPAIVPEATSDACNPMLMDCST